MNKQSILQALEQAKKSSKERKFTQRIDFIITLKDLNPKKPEEQVDLYIELPHETGKQIKVCGLVAEELAESAKKNLDFTITNDRFAEFKDKAKELKVIAKQHTYFIAQATIMPLVAKTFGQVLGKKGKMPNPKAGCVVPPSADLVAVKNRLKKMIRVSSKTEAAIKCSIGTEKMNPEHVAENALAVYTRVKSALPRETDNIRDVLIKLTMGSIVKVAKQ